jgi:uncharacterized membrane protein
MKKVDVIEICSVVICLLFAIVISLYHNSYNADFGLSEKTWNVIWAFAENGFTFTLCLIIGLYFSGVMRVIFRYVFVPYFVFKLVYHFSCLSGVHILPVKTWENIWSSTLGILFVVMLIYALILIRRYNAT